MLTEEELNALITEVESDIVSLAKSEAVMQKDDELPAEEMQEEDAMADAAMADAPATDDAPADDAMMDDAAAMEDQAALEDQMQAGAEDEIPAEDMVEDTQEGDEMQEGLSMEDLVAIYAEMDEQELEMHYEALRQALEMAWGAGVQKSEDCEDDLQKPEAQEEETEEEMEKSEKEISVESDDSDLSAEEKIKALESSIEGLVKALNSKLPQRKSITELEASSEKEPTISRDQLTKKAKELTALPLSKSERDVLNQFFVKGIGENQVLELIKAKKA